ncbi:hypothetical protein [Paramicrobacterium agarici]|uniref:hypothetical protein n=1 Tax=Paramicrobacterium agarici TaxID=630514 RepID=UPI001152543B|nr:hypothetical protein [Microbacterium agarici]
MNSKTSTISTETVTNSAKDLQSLEDRANHFALETMETLAEIIPSGNLGFEVLAAVSSGNPQVVVRQAEPEGLVLTVEDQELLRLIVDYKCSWNSASEYLAVVKSTFEVRFRGVTEPLYRYDYLRESGTAIPAAHINVHANRDEIVMAMVGAGNKGRGKSRIKQLDLSGGRIPRLSQIHFPVGGHRFRPCLEDVLEMVILEFGIDVKDGTYRTAIADGRERFRRVQLQAAVGDDPELAAEKLRELGFSVDGVARRASARLDRTRAY